MTKDTVKYDSWDGDVRQVFRVVNHKDRADPFLKQGRCLVF